MKYIFKQIDDYTPSTTTVKFDADSLDTIMQQFQFFLKGSGFHFDGIIDVVPTDETDDDVFIGDMYDETDVMPHIVNSLMNPPTFNATGMTGQNAN